MSPKTLQGLFDARGFVTGEIRIPEEPAALIMDAVYLKRGRGIVVARAKGKTRAFLETGSERVDDYRRLARLLIHAGMSVSCFVIDGKRGVLHMLQREFDPIPVQLCQFHQVQTLTTYLTKRPRLEAGIQLRRIALDLKYCGRRRFKRKLMKWYQRWNSFLNEKTPDQGKRGWHYTHKRLRSAYRSIANNLPYLFTYLKYPHLDIPNTTNSCDGYFSHLKNRLNVHRGLRADRKRKMLHYLLENS